jgi:hypothetical protein
MHILSKQRLDEIVGVLKFCGSIAHNHRFPPPNLRMGKTPPRLISIQLLPAHHRLVPILSAPSDSFRKRFPPLLILLLRGHPKMRGSLSGRATPLIWLSVDKDPLKDNRNRYEYQVLQIWQL